MVTRGNEGARDTFKRIVAFQRFRWKWRKRDLGWSDERSTGHMEKKIGEEERGRPFFPPMSSSQTCTMQTLHRFWLPLPTTDTRLPLVPKWSSNEMPSLFVASFWNDRTILTECPRHTVDKALKAGLNWNERKFFKGLRYRGLWSLDCVCSWIFLFYCRVTLSKMNLHLTYYWSAWL